MCLEDAGKGVGTEGAFSGTGVADWLRPLYQSAGYGTGFGKQCAQDGKHADAHDAIEGRTNGSHQQPGKQKRV